MTGRKPQTDDGQKGYVLVVVALCLVTLFGFAALGVDVGMLYSARTAAQRAADAAATAGAFTFIVSPTAPQPATARDHALATATSNNVFGTPIAAGEVTIQVDVPNQIVTVDIQQGRGTYFARALGRDVVDVAVRGVAEAADNAQGSVCVKPWFIPNTALSAQAPCDACEDGEVLIQDGEITELAQQYINSGSNQFVVKPNSPTNSLAPGQFFAIELADSVGGNDYRQNIAKCSSEPVFCGKSYSVETGNMVGPTTQGVRDLIGPSPDRYVAAGQYRRADGTITDTSRSLISVPIWDTCGVADFCPAGKFPAGTNVSVQVIGFALLFLEGVQGNDVNARLVGVTPCGPLQENEELGPYAIPLRLVRPAQQ